MVAWSGFVSNLSITFRRGDKSFRKPFSFVYNVFEPLTRKAYSNDTTKLFDLLKKMPKERPMLAATRLQAHRNVAEKNRPASEIYLQVLGNGARGSARSLFVFTDQWRYLFNCGEGTQRSANEFKAKLSRLDHIFVTHRSWENIGGLPGLILTIQNMGVPKITLHGPNGIENLFDMTKGFMLTEEITIEKKSIESGEYRDHILSVDYVPLYGARLTRVESQEVDEDDEVEDYYQELRTKQSSASKDKDLTRSPSYKKQKVSALTEDYDVTVAYICRPSSKPGQLMLDKCLEHGVPPGPLLGLLKSGQDVTLPNGTTVKSSDVVSPEEPGPVFIVVECPTIDFLDSLLENTALAAHQNEARSTIDRAVLVVHFTPGSVLRHSKYQAWMQRFHQSTEHLILNDDNDGPLSFAVHKLQHKLHLLHPEIFPLLKDSRSVNVTEQHNETSRNERHAETMLKYCLRPLLRFDTSSQIRLNPEEFVSECTAMPPFLQVLADLKSKLQSSTQTSERYPEVVFLGTGSSIPSKVRNTSGILVNMNASKSIIMDCGEGTFGQLLRFYGRDDTNAVLRRIVAIYVSHLHADHHIGLIQLLKERRKAFLGQEFVPLALLAPRQILNWLVSYHNVFEPILDEFKLIGNATLFSNLDRHDNPNYVELLNNLDLQKIDTVHVRHCPHSFGVALTHKNNWKLVYTGDTMPCDGLTDIGMNCDVLIHEATMEDELGREAANKRHSTTSEAIESGMKMKAKFIVLTHFSQRYAKVPLYNENFHSRVGIAFDNMKVAFNQLQLLPYFMDALKTMFADELEDMQEKTAKKKRRVELANEILERSQHN